MKGWKTNAALAAISILVAAGLMELGLRVARVAYIDFYRYDPQLGDVLRPGVSGPWTKEGYGYVSINSDGLRDVEHSIAKQAGTFRIAVLGDSYAEAFQVNREEAFWAVMERRLVSCPRFGGQRLEVINFGKSGFGTAQELLVLRSKVWKYSPDLVLLAFLTGNDISDNSRMLKTWDHDPYFVLKGDELVLDDKRTRENFEKRASDWGDIRMWVRNRSRVLQVWREAEKAIEAHISGRGSESQPLADQPGSEKGLYDQVYIEPVNEVWADAWRVTEKLLSVMAKEVRQMGAGFCVVTLSNNIQVHPDSSARNDFQTTLGATDLFYPDRRIMRVCQQEGIPVLILAPSLLEYAVKNQVFLHGFGKGLGSGHWNQEGHRVAGEKMSDWLCTVLTGESG